MLLACVVRNRHIIALWAACNYYKIMSAQSAVTMGKHNSAHDELAFVAMH